MIEKRRCSPFDQYHQHRCRDQSLELSNRYQKQNELLMIPPLQPKRRFFTFLRRK